MKYYGGRAPQELHRWNMMGVGKKGKKEKKKGRKREREREREEKKGRSVKTEGRKKRDAWATNPFYPTFTLKTWIGASAATIYYRREINQFFRLILPPPWNNNRRDRIIRANDTEMHGCARILAIESAVNSE